MIKVWILSEIQSLVKIQSQYNSPHEQIKKGKKYDNLNRYRKKSSDKNQHSFMIQPLRKLRINVYN